MKYYILGTIQEYLTKIKSKDFRAFWILCVSVACWTSIGFLAPSLLPQIMYKLGVICLAVCTAFWLDILLHPLMRIKTYINDKGEILNEKMLMFCVCRRVVMCGIVVLGMALTI